MSEHAQTEGEEDSPWAHTAHVGMEQVENVKGIHDTAKAFSLASGSGARTMAESWKAMAHHAGVDIGKAARGPLGGMGTLGGLFKTFMGGYGVVNGISEIGQGKYVEGGLDILSGGCELAEVGGAVAQASGLGSGLASAASAANPVGAVAGAASLGIKIGQKGLEKTKEWGWFGEEDGVVDAHGDKIKRSSGDWAADVGVGVDHDIHNAKGYRDEEGRFHSTEEFGPSVGGVLGTIGATLLSAPSTIAAGVMGMVEDVGDFVGGLFGPSKIGAAGAKELGQQTSAVTSVSNAAVGQAEQAASLAQAAQQLPEGHPMREALLENARAAIATGLSFAGQMVGPDEGAEA